VQRRGEGKGGSIEKWLDDAIRKGLHGIERGLFWSKRIDKYLLDRYNY
jgi:hypothetical protein